MWVKINNKAPMSIRGKSKEATAVEQSINALIKKYGLDIVRFVSNRILRDETEKKRLEREITQKERELEALRRKKKP